MEPIDRIALIVTPRRRFLEWVNRLPDPAAPLSVDDAKSLRMVCLVAVDDDELDLQELIDAYWDDLFEEALAGWTSDESLWPPNRTPHVFRDWFQVEYVGDVSDFDPDRPLTVSERVMTECANCSAPLDEIVFVAVDEDGARRLTPEDVERYKEDLLRAAEEEGSFPEDEELEGEEDEPEDDEDESPPRRVVLRCCSPACAAQIEAAYQRALDAPDVN